MAMIYKKLVGGLMKLKSRSNQYIKYLSLLLSEKNEMIVSEDGDHIIEE